MRTSVALLAVAASLLISLLPGASAEEGELVLEARLPGLFQGAVGVSSTGGDLLAQGNDGAATLGVVSSSLDFAMVEMARYRPAPPIQGVEFVTESRIDQATYDDATLRLRDRSDAFTLLAASDGVWDVRTRAPAPAAATALERTDLRWGSLASALTVRSDAPADDGVALPVPVVFGRPIPYERTVPEGSYELTARDGEARVAGSLDGFVQGATLVLHADGRAARTFEVRSGWEERPGDVYVPEVGWIGSGSHREYVTRYVQFHADDGALQFTGRDAPASLFGERLAFDVDGVLAFPWARGHLETAAGERVPLDAGPVLLAGRLAFQPVAPDGETHDRTAFRAQGDFTYVQGPGVRHTYAAPVAVAVGLGALLVAALGGLWVWAKGLPAFLVPLYARVLKDDALDHDARERIYEAVKAEPGVNANMLAAKFEFGWSTLLYHLKVLERSDLVVSIREGRYRRYFDKASGKYSNGRKYVVAALRNPTTKKVADLVRAQPGQTQKDLAAALGLAASTVHWHMVRLEQVHLVTKQRDGQHVRYGPGEAWSALDGDAAAPRTGAARPLISASADLPASAAPN